MNLLSIRALALSMLRDAGGDVASPVEVDALINQGQLDFVERTDFLHDTALIDLVSDQAVYTLPEAAMRVKRVALDEEVLRPTTSSYLDSVDSLWRITTGTPTHYLRDLFGHDKLRVYPIPVKSGSSLQTAQFFHSQEEGVIRGFSFPPSRFSQEPGIIRSVSALGPDYVSGTLRIDYVKYPTDLTHETDVPEIPRQYHRALAAYAAGHIFLRNGSDKGAAHIAEYEAAVASAASQAEQTFQASIDRGTPYRYL